MAKHRVEYARREWEWSKLRGVVVASIAVVLSLIPTLGYDTSPSRHGNSTASGNLPGFNFSWIWEAPSANAEEVMPDTTVPPVVDLPSPTR